jgi:hypothetical protein
LGGIVACSPTVAAVIKMVSGLSTEIDTDISDVLGLASSQQG